MGGDKEKITGFVYIVQTPLGSAVGKHEPFR